MTETYTSFETSETVISAKLEQANKRKSDDIKMSHHETTRNAVELSNILNTQKHMYDLENKITEFLNSVETMRTKKHLRSTQKKLCKLA